MNDPDLEGVYLFYKSLTMIAVILLLLVIL